MAKKEEKKKEKISEKPKKPVVKGYENTPLGRPSFFTSQSDAKKWNDAQRDYKDRLRDWENEYESKTGRSIEAEKHYGVGGRNVYGEYAPDHYSVGGELKNASNNMLAPMSESDNRIDIGGGLSDFSGLPTVNPNATGADIYGTNVAKQLSESPSLMIPKVKPESDYDYIKRIQSTYGSYGAGNKEPEMTSEELFNERTRSAKPMGEYYIPDVDRKLASVIDKEGYREVDFNPAVKENYLNALSQYEQQKNQEMANKEFSPGQLNKLSKINEKRTNIQDQYAGGEGSIRFGEFKSMMDRLSNQEQEIIRNAPKKKTLQEKYKEDVVVADNGDEIAFDEKNKKWYTVTKAEKPEKLDKDEDVNKIWQSTYDKGYDRYIKILRDTYKTEDGGLSKTWPNIQAEAAELAKLDADRRITARSNLTPSQNNEQIQSKVQQRVNELIQSGVSTEEIIKNLQEKGLDPRNFKIG